MNYVLSSNNQHVLLEGHPLNRNTRYGMFALVLVSFASILCTGSILGFVTFYAVPRKVKSRITATQRSFLLVITQLILADFIQSIGFFMSINWLSNSIIDNQSPVCFVQGFIINMGDMASAFFVLYMALQTLFQLRHQCVLSRTREILLIVSVWMFSIILSVLGPIIYSGYFVPTGAWCWAAPWFPGARILFHYAWIFIVEFSTIIIYAMVYHELRKLDKRLKLASEGVYINTVSGALLRQNCVRAIVYPIAYTVLTLPLAVCRMVVFNMKMQLSSTTMCAVGIIITSGGWVDSILYVWGRKSLIRNLITTQNSTHELTTCPRNQSYTVGHSDNSRISSRVVVNTAVQSD